MHQLDPELGCVIGVICLMQMSDGVFFTGLMEMHSIGDLEMLTGNSIHNTSVSSHHMSDAETWKCSQEIRNAHRKFDSKHECQLAPYV